MKMSLRNRPRRGETGRASSEEESDNELRIANLGWNLIQNMEEDVVDEPPDSNDESDEQFDIALPATHSYLSSGLVAVRGRSVLEAGWRGSVPCVGHHSILYPGETVPMVITHPRDCELLYSAIQGDKLFGLLFPEFPEDSRCASGYGVLCEVFEATAREPYSTADPSLTFKARARQRFKFHALHEHAFIDTLQVRQMDIEILPEVSMGDPLMHSRMVSLDHLRSTRCKRTNAKIKQMDVLATNWPLFVFNGYDFRKLIKILHNYFSELKYDSLPSDIVSLSFWAASNLPLSYKDRLELFRENNALQRLRMEVNFVEEYYMLCCVNCGDTIRTPIARREDIFAMSSEGMKSNYCNLGGYVHDIMTVTQISNIRTNGPPSAEFSWFPGYKWTILLCKYCGTHIGWRFTAIKKSFQRQKFYAICRNYVFPYSARDAYNK